MVITSTYCFRFYLLIINKHFIKIAFILLIAYFGCSRAKTVNENLKMNAPLLSRFDLVFILLDKHDELLDKRVSEHIMSVSHYMPSPSVVVDYLF